MLRIRQKILALLAVLFGALLRPIQSVVQMLVTRAVKTLQRAGLVLSTATLTLVTLSAVTALILLTLCLTLAFIAPLQAWLFSERLLALTGLQQSHVTQEHVIHWQYHTFPARDSARGMCESCRVKSRGVLQP